MAKQTLSRISFELFPPKTTHARQELYQVIHQLATLHPEYISVTYGAGGSTQESTCELVDYIQKNTTIPPAAHLTCVNATQEAVDGVARRYHTLGITRIIALRGDMPDFQAYQPYPGGYGYAGDLVTGLRKLADFDISVAAYPETHPEAYSGEQDLDYLQKKIAAGANRAITQYCFDTDKIIAFIERAQKIGINVPIIPGIMPIHNFQQVVKFSKKCGATIPESFKNRFAKYTDKDSHYKLAIDITTEQCLKLMEYGHHTLHFYTLNRAELVMPVCEQLGIVPKKDHS